MLIIRRSNCIIQHLVLRVLFFLCYSVLLKLTEDLNFFHNVFKTLGFFYSFLTFNLLSCLIVLLLLGLLCIIYEV